MASGNIIKEFLVAIGYKVDEPAMKKMVGGVKSVTLSVVELGGARHFAELGRVSE